MVILERINCTCCRKEERLPEGGNKPLADYFATAAKRIDQFKKSIFMKSHRDISLNYLFVSTNAAADLRMA
jgi:hypothetical protein